MKRPTPEALRRRKTALQKRKEQIHAQLALKRQRRAAQPRLGSNEQKPPARARWLSAVLAALLVASLLQRCDSMPPEVVEVTVPCSPEEGAAEDALQEPRPPPPVARRSRPSVPPVAAGPLPWIDAFQRQVAARGPRLAACFEGALRSGALKWSAAVEPASGHTSDHAVETLLGSPPLTSAQRSCVLDVLSDPGYRLDASRSRATPTRVSLVVEF